MFKVPEKYRIKNKGVPWLESDSSFGNNGAFKIPLSGRTTAFAIASDGEGWEHVSVSCRVDNKKDKTPTWAEMCKIKSMFWDDEDCVIQYHPQKSAYVNNHKHTLHLWRPIGVELPQPKTILVGVV